MSKENTVRASILSASALVALLLFSSAITAQKSPTPPPVPAQGIEVTMVYPDGSKVKQVTDVNGNIKWPPLSKGHYSLTVKDPSRGQNGANGRAASDVEIELYQVEMAGAGVVGRKVHIEFDFSANNQRASSTTHGDIAARDKTVAERTKEFKFEIGEGQTSACQTTIMKRMHKPFVIVKE